MPYIIPARRSEINPTFDHDQFFRYELRAKTAGELNYQFTELLIDYFKRNSNYQGINDIIGALEGAKLEFYRRIVAPYEDKKILENGDIY
jgi:hypothetical protein